MISLSSAVIDDTTKSAQKIADNYQHDLEVFNKALERFCMLIQQEEWNPAICKEHYGKLRDAYKKVSYIWEYTDPLYVKEWINGPPLPHLDKVAPTLMVIEPGGLQVLDEILYSGKPDIHALRKTAQELKQAANAYVHTSRLNDRIVFEAMRMELIRLFTLGLSAFELPASDRSLADAKVVLGQLKLTTMAYAQPDHPEINLQMQLLVNLYDLGIRQLNATDEIDRLDHLRFLMTVINPLFKQLGQLQKSLGVESIYESTPGIQFALNLDADNLFSEQLLNPSFYSSIPNNALTPGLIRLGQYLFFDPVLSADQSRSCASCHQPEKAFSDGLPKSKATGSSGFVDRNAPTLMNCIYSERFFHDLRADALSDQIEHVVVSEKEFNTSFLEIMQRLSGSKAYMDLFKAAFPQEANPIQQRTVAWAISAFVSSLRSFQSPFDNFVRGESTHLNAAAKRGFNLFMGKAACATCHFAPNFSGTVPPLYSESESEVLGVPENPYTTTLILDKDPGRMNAKLKEASEIFRHSFKTPTLRNSALTAPYMHNGAYRSLKDVVEFYNRGGGSGLGLVVPNQTLPGDSLHLTNREIGDLVAFMQSLSDTSHMGHIPDRLPEFENPVEWNNRNIGGTY
jgi:cytochrome c peroxidase